MNIDKLSDEVDLAFAHRDTLMAVYDQTQRKRDHDAMLRQEAKACQLLDRYNLACKKEQEASDRARAENIRKFSEEKRA